MEMSRSHMDVAVSPSIFLFTKMDLSQASRRVSPPSCLASSHIENETAPNLPRLLCCTFIGFKPHLGQIGPLCKEGKVFIYPVGVKKQRVLGQHCIPELGCC